MPISINNLFIYIILFLFSINCFFSISCSSSQKASSFSINSQSTTMIRGDRKSSSSRRTAENLPRPWNNDHSSFDSDRFLIGAYASRKHLDHIDAHERRSLQIQSFSHPVCANIPEHERSLCPLSSHKWFKKVLIPSGVVIYSRDSKININYLRMNALCHIVFSRVMGIDDGCPLHVDSVQVRIGFKKGEVFLEFFIRDKRNLYELRRRVESLFQ